LGTQYTAREQAANAKYLNIGCKGGTPFMDLPNFDWKTFWVPGVAHALLLGVVKDLFYHVLFRPKQDSIPYGREYWISTPVKRHMLSLVKSLSPTSGFPRGFTAVLGYAVARVPASACFYLAFSQIS
jgi:hypothetical protein